MAQSNLDKLAAQFQQSLDKSKQSERDKRDTRFSRDVFRALAPLCGASVRKFMELWSEDYEDFAYDIKFQFPEVQGIHTTGAMLAKHSDMFKPAKEIPHRIWASFLEAVHNAWQEWQLESAALVFRLRGNKRWVMTNESWLTIPQLHPVVHITAPTRAPEVRILPWELYVKLLEEHIRDQRG